MGQYHLWAADRSLTVSLHLAPSGTLPCISECLGRSCGHSGQSSTGVQGCLPAVDAARGLPGLSLCFLGWATASGPGHPLLSAQRALISAPEALGGHSVTSSQFVGPGPSFSEKGILLVQTVSGEAPVPSPRARWLPLMNPDFLPGKRSLSSPTSRPPLLSLWPHWPLPLWPLVPPQGSCICAHSWSALPQASPQPVPAGHSGLGCSTASSRGCPDTSA